MEAAAAFLAVRSRSVEETRQRLNHLGYPAALCDEVVDRLVELRYLDDAEFAKAWVESRDRTRPRGSVALRRELERKGVPGDIIEAVLSVREETASAGADPPAEAAAPDADRLAARRLIERRAASLARESDPRRRRQKAYALLARNGFTPDVCNEVAASLVADPTEEGGV